MTTTVSGDDDSDTNENDKNNDDDDEREWCVHHNEYNEIDRGNGNNINFEITMWFSYYHLRVIVDSAVGCGKNDGCPASIETVIGSTVAKASCRAVSLHCCMST